IICLYSKLEPVPQFRNMSLLHAKLLPTHMKWEWVDDYDKMCSDEMDQISFHSAPECLLSSLEFVDIKSSVSRHVAEMKLVRYFLESSAMLRELTLRLNCDATQDVIFKSLLKMSRRSATCEVTKSNTVPATESPKFPRQVYPFPSAKSRSTLPGYLYKIWLPAILESFPNLKSLSWECDAEYEELHFEEMKEISFAYVPECLHSSLELIDFKVPFSGLAGEMKVVRYFLENSALLKKLTLHCRRDCSTKSKFKKKLLRIPRASTICEVVIL
ncbi:unnamed protein product, partial [Thlaspi arvense]